MVPTAERLALYRPVYAPDLPGFGRSVTSKQVLSVPQLADVLAAWMRCVGIERAAFIGNSLGCQVIANLALRHPATIERAVLVGPTLDPHASALGDIWRLLCDSNCEPLSFLPILLEDCRRAGLRRTIATFRHALADHTERKYVQMRVPMLVVRGQRDPIVPQRWAEELTRSLPNAQLRVIPRVGHAVNFTAPDVLVRTIRPFLEASSPLVDPGSERETYRWPDHMHWREVAAPPH
jgi:2-hydroxy-6-oxonona-2,4-dienedioate hydrolase